MEAAIALILKALATGAAAASLSVGKEAMQNAYNGLKALLKRKFGDNEDAGFALRSYEKKPLKSKELLADALEETGAAADKDVEAAAQKVMEIAAKHQEELNNATLTIGGDAYGTIMSNLGTVDMTFNFGTKEDPKA